MQLHGCLSKCPSDNPCTLHLYYGDIIPFIHAFLCQIRSYKHCVLIEELNKAKCFAVNLLIACFNRSFFPFDQDPVWEESAQWKDVEAAVTERASAVHAAEASLLKAKYDVERKCESMLELRTRATASLGITPLNIFTGRNWTPPESRCSFAFSLLFLVKSWQTLRLKSTSLRR